MKDRVEWTDFLSGILIVWMIIYHIFIFTGNKQTLACEELYKIFFFFMPWFFFKSGTFTKRVPFKTLLTSGIRKLLVPYVIFSILGYLAYTIQQLIYNEITIEKMIIEPALTLLLTGSVLGNLPLWFLLALFLDKLLWKAFSYLKLNSIIIAIFSLIICYGGYLLEIKQPFYLWFTFSGLLFYSLGDIFKYIQFNNYLFLTSLCLYSIAIVVFPNSVQMRSNSLEFGYYLLWPLTSLAAIIFWNNISQRIEIIRNRLIFIDKTWRTIKLIGQNSIYLYVTHALIVVPASAALRYKGNIEQFCILSFVLILTLPICSWGAKLLLDYINHFVVSKYDE